MTARQQPPNAHPTGEPLTVIEPEPASLLSRSSIFLFAWLGSLLLLFIGVPILGMVTAVRIVETCLIAAALTTAIQRPRPSTISPCAVILGALGMITAVAAEVGMVHQRIEPSPYQSPLYGGTPFGPIQLLIDQIASFAAFYLLATATAIPAGNRVGFLFAIEAVAGAIALLASIELVRNFATGDRIQAGFGNPNLLASFLVMCLPLVICNAFRRSASAEPQPWERVQSKPIDALSADSTRGDMVASDESRAKNSGPAWLTRLLLAGLILVELWFTGSRGALIGVGVATAMLAVAWTTRRRFAVNKSALVGVLVVVLAAVCVLASRHGGAIGRISHTRSDQQRVIVWRAALSIAEAHPLTGVGLGAFPSAMRDLRLKEPNDITPSGLPMTPAVHLHAHDLFLEFAAERGIGGFCCSLLLVGALFVRTLSSRRGKQLPATSLAAGFGLIALTVQNLFDYTLWYAPVLLLAWSFAGVLAAPSSISAVSVENLVLLPERLPAE